MKFNFAVDINDCNDVYDIQDEIMDRATNAFMQQIIGNRWEEKSLTYQFEERIDKKLNEITSKDFKDLVADKVVEKLTERFEKSKQYKELVKGNEIESDYAIKSGLKDIVKEIVKSEMKNMFK